MESDIISDVGINFYIISDIPLVIDQHSGSVVLRLNSPISGELHLSRRLIIMTRVALPGSCISQIQGEKRYLSRLFGLSCIFQ